MSKAASRAASLLIGFALAAGAAGSVAAATVPTERITAPRALEPGPDGSLPGDRPEQKIPRPDEDPVPDEVLPRVQYGEEGLPPAVRQTRQDLLEAATNADFERLRLIYDANDPRPALSFGEIDDPIEFLKQSSGDGNGLELLAIMIEVLQSGWVHKNPGTREEMYVWPYFAELPLSVLDDVQKVELFKILTAADFEEMQTFGSYIFYRLGIGADGTWYYFFAGD